MAPLPSLFDLPATLRPGCRIVPSLELDEDPLLSAIDATLNRPIHAAAPLAVELDGDVDPDAVVATPSPLRRRSNSATPALLAVTPTVKAALLAVTPTVKAASPAPAPAALHPPVAGRSVPRKPRRLYGRYVLRVVSPSGATLSETEVVRSPLPCLFSMEQARTLAAVRTGGRTSPNILWTSRLRVCPSFRASSGTWDVVWPPAARARCAANHGSRPAVHSARRLLDHTGALARGRGQLHQRRGGLQAGDADGCKGRRPLSLLRVDGTRH